MDRKMPLPTPQTVLVTGGSGGLGLALARQFAAHGFALVLTAGNADRLETAGQTLRREYPGVAVRWLAEDLARPDGAAALVRTLEKEQIHVDILVNNAGAGSVGPAETLPLTEEERLLCLDVWTPVALCKLLLPAMYRRRQGKILNVASVGAFQPGPYTASYYAAKAYLYSYSRALRLEAAGRGIQVCTLCPGSLKTEFFRRAGAKTPGFATPPEQAAAYAYRKLMQNRAVVVPGFANRLLRVVPAGIKSRAIAAIKKKSVLPPK